MRLLAAGGNGDRSAGVAHLDIDQIGVQRTDAAAGFNEDDAVKALANEAAESADACADGELLALVIPRERDGGVSALFVGVGFVVVLVDGETSVSAGIHA